MLGHAFDAYSGSTALIEGNVFEAVDQPMTSETAAIDTVYNVADASAASACSSYIGRECVLNELTSSGDWPAMSSENAFSALSSATDYLITPIAASEVKAYVTSNAGPANLASYTGFSGSTSSGGSNSTLASTNSNLGTGSTGSTGSSYTTGSPTATASAQPSNTAGSYSGFQGSGAHGPSPNGWGSGNSRVAAGKTWKLFQA